MSRVKDPSPQISEDADSRRYEGKVRLEAATLARARQYCFNNNTKMQDLLLRATEEFLDRAEGAKDGVYTHEESKLARSVIAALSQTSVSDPNYVLELLTAFPQREDAMFARRFLAWFNRAQNNVDLRYIAEMVVKLIGEE